MSNETRTWWNGNNCHMEHMETSTVVAYCQPGLSRPHIERLCAAKLEHELAEEHYTPMPKEIYTQMERDLRTALVSIGTLLCGESGKTKTDILEVINKALKS